MNRRAALVLSAALLSEVVSLQGLAQSTPERPASKLLTVEAIFAHGPLTGQPPQVITEAATIILALRLPRTALMLLTGAVFGKGAVREVIEKKVASYLDKTASLSQIVDEIHRLIGDPETEEAKK